jgi:hypothetical protein
MTGRLVLDTLSQACYEAAGLAMTPTSSVCGSSVSASVGGGSVTGSESTFTARSRHGGEGGGGEEEEDGGGGGGGGGGCGGGGGGGEGGGENDAKIEIRERQMLLGSHSNQRGRVPLHLLCANHSITPQALVTLLSAAKWAACVPDTAGMTALHVLCCNRRVTSELLEVQLK